jgi:FkbM family methyltransferase
MQYYGQLEIDKYLYENYFPNVKNGFFVECGAADGLTESTCKFFEESMNWTGINIEPVPSSYEKLIINRPNSTNYNVALHNEHTTKKFVHLQSVKSPDYTFGLGRILKDNEKFEDNEDWNYIEFDVKCRKFSELFKENREIDLFVLDVEGNEIEAMEGILEINKLFHPKIFCIEVTKIDMEKLNSMLCNNYTISERRNQDIIYKKS